MKALYNEKGYFNIKSGKHRIVFLIVMGQQYVPLRISKGDYQKWRDEKSAAQIYELLEVNHIVELPCILDSPYFYEYPCHTSNFYGRLLSRLTGILYSDEYNKRNGFYFEGKKILLCNTPLALYTHMFRRIGFHVTIVEENIELRKLIDMVTGEKNEFETRYVILEEPYYLIVREDGEMSHLEDFKGKCQYVLSVTNKKMQTEKAILSGCSEQGLIYAFLRKYY